MHFALQIMQENMGKAARPNRTVSHQNLSIFHIVKQFSAVMICTAVGKKWGCRSLDGKFRRTFQVARHRADLACDLWEID